MKKMVLAAVLAFFSSSAFADWTESVSCLVERISVDDQTVATAASTADVLIAGGHNSEYGKTTIANDLTPSYTISVERASSGRTEYMKLSVARGKELMGMSSIDMQQREAIATTFITKSGDYQITVSCVAVVKN